MTQTKSTIPRPSAATLHYLYIVEGLDCPDIGRGYQRDSKTVLWWLRQARIPTRPRGSNPAVHFKAGVRSAFAGRKHRPESIAKVRASTLADGRVPYLRDGRHWLKGSPPAANGRWLGGVTPERQAFYRSPEWKAACVVVWHRADAKCERCAKDHRLIDRTVESFHVHHIVSFAVRELRAEPTNLAPLCQDCHRWVHGKANTAREFLAATTTSYPSTSSLKRPGVIPVTEVSGRCSVVEKHGVESFYSRNEMLSPLPLTTRNVLPMPDPKRTFQALYLPFALSLKREYFGEDKSQLIGSLDVESSLLRPCQLQCLRPFWLDPRSKFDVGIKGLVVYIPVLNIEATVRMDRRDGNPERVNEFSDVPLVVRSFFFPSERSLNLRDVQRDYYREQRCDGRSDTAKSVNPGSLLRLVHRVPPSPRRDTREAWFGLAVEELPYNHDYQNRRDDDACDSGVAGPTHLASPFVSREILA